MAWNSSGTLSFVSLCLSKKCSSGDTTEQLRTWLMPELAQPKNLGSSPPTSHQGQGSPADSPPSRVPGEGTVGVTSVGYSGTFETDPPIILPEDRTGGMYCRWKWPGRARQERTWGPPVLLGFQCLLPDCSYSQLKPSEMLSRWTWGPQHQPCHAHWAALLANVDTE